MAYAIFVTLTVVVLISPIAHCVTDRRPLHLTPLIENGEILRAQQLSRINTDVIPNSHSAFLTVNKQRGNHMFFWFFPAIAYPHDAPLLVWLNGGPGISSMIGLFYENGPMRIARLDNGTISYNRWSKSWAQKFSMLYIDQPIGTGYSYNKRNKLRPTIKQKDYSSDLYTFLEQFYLLFPEYNQRELYIGGQSYAGKYVPAVAHRVHMEKLANRSSLPLTGIYLGGPLFDAKAQCRASADFLEAVGALSIKQSNIFRTKFANFIKNGENYKSLSTGELLDNMWPHVNLPTYDNYITLKPNPFEDVTELMTSKAMRRLVHAGNRRYEAVSMDVYDRFVRDIMTSTTVKLAELMDHYKVLIYNGDLDARTSTAMIEAGVRSISWSRQAEYNDSTRTRWGASYKPKGFFTSVGEFCRVVIYNSGHRLPHDQPDVSREMMEHFIKFGCIQNWNFTISL